jgi:hypothetical protein
MIRRHAARAILIDDAGRLVLIKRTRPGQVPYWTTAGGKWRKATPRQKPLGHRMSTGRGR